MIGELDQSWQHLELRHLAALEAVAAAGSFRAAARALGFSQSAVSEQVASLERIVGCRLLDRARGGRQVTPTAAGRLVLDHLEAISGPVRRLRAELATQAIGHATVRLGIYQASRATCCPRSCARSRRAGSPSGSTSSRRSMTGSCCAGSRTTSSTWPSRACR